ncbi:DUF2267 domain-containing protein [Pseudonocardia sichuanensis]
MTPTSVMSDSTTLQVLGRRLAGGQTRIVTAQLASDLATVLPAAGPGERFGVEEFYRRVAEAEGGSWTPQQARRHARAALSALKAGLTGHEYGPGAYYARSRSWVDLRA